MSEGYDTSKVLTWVLGVVGSLVTVGIIAMVTMLLGMGDRLTRIETTINENRAERHEQVRRIEVRVERLESDFFQRRRGED